MAKCLVVGDRDLIAFIREAVLPLDLEIVITTNGIEAVMASEVQVFDVIVAELEMTVMDGRELVDRVSRLQNNIRVLFVSQHPEIYVLQLACPHITIQKSSAPDVICEAVRHLLMVSQSFSTSTMAERFREIRAEIERTFNEIKKGTTRSAIPIG
jgi:CheY-like chemotaxis protein